MIGFFKSTYSQLTLIFGLLLLFNFIVIMLSLRQITVTPAANQMARQINNQVISLKPLLKNISFNQAKEKLNDLYSSNQIIVSVNPQAKPFPSLKFYQTLKNKLYIEGANQVLLKESATQSMIFLKPQWLKNYWLGVTFQPFIQKVSKWFVLLIVALMLMSMFAAYFFSRYMLKPLKQLANMATDIVEEKKNVNDIHIKGTTEVQEIGQLVKSSALQVQQLNKEKEMLLAGVSHDLRTPLARMRLQAEFLNDNDIRNNLVQEIEEMDHIIGDFVTFVRLGTIEEFQTIDLVRLISDTVNNYHNNGQYIEWRTVKKSLQMQLKPLSIKRMLTNIYDNAFKYGESPVVITLEQTQDLVKVCIRDHGNGIENTDITEIFEPFFMSQTADNQYGSGLGLSIVKKLAQQNKAQVHAENHKNGGLIICIEWHL